MDGKNIAGSKAPGMRACKHGSVFCKEKLKNSFLKKSNLGYMAASGTQNLCDITLQLNYHSIHHRAKMQMLIRQQGIEPDFIDYIRTKYQKIS